MERKAMAENGSRCVGERGSTKVGKPVSGGFRGVFTKGWGREAI